MKQLGEKVDCEGVGTREKSGERHSRLDRERTNIVLSLKYHEVLVNDYGLVFARENLREENRHDAKCLLTEFPGNAESGSTDRRN